MSNHLLKKHQDVPLSTIKRTAFDTIGRLGSLYDACQDQPLRLLDVTFQQPLIQYHDKTTCTLEKGDHIQKRNLLEMVQIDNQLRLSLILNLTYKNGIASIINYPYRINEYSRILHYSYIHRDEDFPDEVHKIRERLEIGLSNTNATHIITSVTWGIEIIIIFQLPTDDTIVKRIDIMLEKYRAYLNGNSNDFKLTREDVEAHKHIIDTKIYSNIPSITEKITMHTVFHSISGIKSNDNEFRQMSYILHPISKSNYIPLDSLHNIQYEHYLYELTNSMKYIETCFNEDMPKLLRGNFTERYSDAHRQWLKLNDDYKNIIDRLSKIIINIRSGQSQVSTLHKILSNKTRMGLRNDTLNLHQNVIDLNRKAHLINDLYHDNITYINVTERDIDKNDNEETLKHKLIRNENTDRILCSNDLLKKRNPKRFHELRNDLIEELENNSYLRLFYADFSYSTYALHDMKILPPLKTHKKRNSIHKDNSLSTDFNSSNFSLLKQSNQLNSSSSKLSNNETINVLLLGETGVGKSTFINGLVNYLTYKTFDRAQTEKPIIAIPSVFRMTTHDRYQEYTIKCGDFTKETNETSQDSDQTSTQRCRSHIYYLNNTNRTKLRIIDTPGFGDIRNPQQDNLHMKNILEYIKKFKYLNAICLFVRPNESKLNPCYTSCLNQLITLLGPDIRHNIVFCFTNSRSTFYTLGSTGLLLKNILSSLSIDDIPLRKKNTFFFDNESFRYLVASQNKIHFNDNEKHEYESSWSNSVTETVRLLRYIRKKLPVYYIPDESQSIRTAEMEIVQLIHPILETIRNLFRRIIRCKMNLLKVSFDSESNEEHLNDTENMDYYYSKSPPFQPKSIDFFEDYRILSGTSSDIQNDLINQITLLCHANVEFSYFLLYVAHYSQGDPFLNGFLRIINEETIICESRNRNYINLQLVEGLKALANNYKQRIESATLNPKRNILANIYQWIKYMHEYPLISEYIIDRTREHVKFDNKVTTI